MTLTAPRPGPTRWNLLVAKGLLDAAILGARIQLAKATTPKAVRDRRLLLATTVPKFTADLEAYFAAAAKRILPVSKALPFQFDPEADVDWAVEEEELTIVLVRWYTSLGVAAYGAAGELLGVELRFDVGERGVQAILKRVAQRVTAITAVTRQAIGDRVAIALERGYSVDQLVHGVADDGFAGLLAFLEDAGRAQTIALTETATAYNLASLEGYRDSGLVDEVLIFDGPECGWTEHDDPDLADGSIRSLDDFDEYPLSHPHCQRAAAPVPAR